LFNFPKYRLFLVVIVPGGQKKLLAAPVKKVASAAEARKNEAKKRSLHVVNEHFEPNFDDASVSAVVFQRAVRALSKKHHRIQQ